MDKKHCARAVILSVFEPGEALRLSGINRRVLKKRGSLFADITTRQTLVELVQRGQLVRVETGLYALKGYKVPEYPMRQFITDLLDDTVAVDARGLKKEYRAATGKTIHEDEFAEELDRMHFDRIAAPLKPGWYVRIPKDQPEMSVCEQWYRQEARRKAAEAAKAEAAKADPFAD